MSIKTEITRITNAKAAIKTAIAAKGVTVPSSASIDDMATYISQIEGGGDADKVDGWHFAVVNKGEAIPTTNTICFVIGG